MKKTLTLSACLGLLLLFSISHVFGYGIDSDNLYPFSYARDLLMAVPVKAWSLAPTPYFFPDILLSLPIIHFIPSPLSWAMIGAFIQVLSLIMLCAAFTQSPQQSYATRFGLACALTIGTYELGFILLGPIWELTQNVLYLGHHLWASLVALALFFLTLPERISSLSRVQKLLLALIFALTAFSDSFFCLYFLCLSAGSAYFIRKDLRAHKKWILSIAALLILGYLAISLNRYLNPSFDKHVKDTPYHRNAIRHVITFFSVTGVRGLLLFFVAPACFLRITKGEIKALSLGLLLISALIVYLGVTEDVASTRYLGIYFPALIIILGSLLPEAIWTYSKSLAFTALVILMALALYLPPMNQVRALYQARSAERLLNCPAFQNTEPGAILVATYWPSKILFESSGRKFSLFQVKEDFSKHYTWTSNPAWAQLHRGKSQELLIVTEGLVEAKRLSLARLPGSTQHCDNQLIITHCSRALIKQAAVLKDACYSP